METTDIIPSRQMELFEKDADFNAMSMTEFSQWVSENTGFGIQKTLQMAAFMLCCDVIAQDISKATLRLRDRLDNGTSRTIRPEEHPIAALLALEPNRRHTWYQFTEMMVLWSCLTSNSYAAILRNNVGDPLEIIPLQTSRVMDKVSGRDIFYDVTAATLHEQALLGRSSATFHERDMIHVRGRNLDGMDGYSTMTVGRQALDILSAIDDYRHQLFNEQGQMRGVFFRDKEGALDEQAFQRLRQQFRALMGKFRQLTEPIVLEDSLKFQTISSNPKDVELTSQFDAQITEICRLLRVPPHKVFLMSGIKYENLETLEKSYVGDTLEPIAHRFEQQYAKALLSREDRLRYFFEYDRSEMMIRDTRIETDRVIKAVERGVITIDEARAVLGYNPLPNSSGQVRQVPVNMVVLDENNQIIVGASGTTPDEDVKPDEESEDTKAGLRLVSSK